MHECYLEKNKGKLEQLRALESKQRKGLLKQGGFLELLRLKESLGIGTPKNSS